MNKKLVITEYTDPICNWCYAADPTIRKVMYLNPEVELHHIMGLMVRDYHKLTGYGPGAEKKFKEIMKHMSAHQGEVPVMANLPYSSKAFAEMKPENMSSYPSSVAIEAMKILDETSANQYIRRIREALHSDGKQITDEEVLLELAAEFPVDQDRFRELFTDGTAERALNEDVEKTMDFGVQGFPTFHIEYGDKHDVFSGYLPYPEFIKCLEKLTDGQISGVEKPFTKDNVLAFIGQFGRVAAGEIALAFDMSDDAVNAMVEELKNSNQIEVEPSDHSYFVREKKVQSMQFCNPETGICSFNYQ